MQTNNNNKNAPISANQYNYRSRPTKADTHLSVKGVFEDLTQGRSEALRLARLCGVHDGALHPSGQRTTHQLGRELDGSVNRKMTRKLTMV